MRPSRLMLLLCFCALQPYVAPAQNNKLDSLLTELKNTAAHADTASMHRRALLQMWISNLYFKPLRDFENSRRYARLALPVFRQLDNKKGEASMLLNIADTYAFESRYPASIDTYLLSYKAWEQVPDTGKMARSASMIANNYSQMQGAPDKAVQYARLCLDLSTRANRVHGVCGCAILLSTIYTDLKQPDSAALYLQNALAILEETNEPGLLASLFITLSKVEEDRKNPSASLQWQLKAAAIYKAHPEVSNADNNANNLLGLGRSYLDLGEIDKATLYLQKVGALLPQLEDLTYQDRYYADMTRLAEIRNRPADALRYYKLHIAARDSLNNAENTRQVTQIQMTHEFEQKQALAKAEQDRETERRDARSRQQRLVFGLLLLGISGLAGFGFYTYRQRQQRRRTELELANLRAQINPHFIFNCLNSIYRYTKERDTDTAAKYLQKFSSLLRLVLENSRTEKITLARDLDALQLYVDIEALRFKEKLRFTLDVAPDIDPSFLQIPGMLIQPHVENAIWHGLMHRREGGQLHVRLTLPAETLLRVEIEDDGIGRAAAAELASKSALTKKSLGQKITAERLRATGKLASSETLDLKDAEGNSTGTRVVLEIPL